jgi:hypothetical protein
VITQRCLSWALFIVISQKAASRPPAAAYNSATHVSQCSRPVVFRLSQRSFPAEVAVDLMHEGGRRRSPSSSLLRNFCCQSKKSCRARRKPSSPVTKSNVSLSNCSSDRASSSGVRNSHPSTAGRALPGNCFRPAVSRIPNSRENAFKAAADKHLQEYNFHCSNRLLLLPKHIDCFCTTSWGMGTIRAKLYHKVKNFVRIQADEA